METRTIVRKIDRNVNLSSMDVNLGVKEITNSYVQAQKDLSTAKGELGKVKGMLGVPVLNGFKKAIDGYNNSMKEFDTLSSSAKSLGLAIPPDVVAKGQNAKTQLAEVQKIIASINQAVKSI